MSLVPRIAIAALFSAVVFPEDTSVAKKPVPIEKHQVRTTEALRLDTVSFTISDVVLDGISTRYKVKNGSD